MTGSAICGPASVSRPHASIASRLSPADAYDDRLYVFAHESTKEDVTYAQRYPTRAGPAPR